GTLQMGSCLICTALLFAINENTSTASIYIHVVVAQPSAGFSVSTTYMRIRVVAVLRSRKAQLSASLQWVFGMGTIMEDVLWELLREETNEQGLPPGFRFHPTDEELVTFYLAAKVFNGSFAGVGMVVIDLNRCEPWELPDIAKLGEREWYFYSLRDRKYPTGLRTNRATEAGYWKATGKDREVYSASTGTLVGMKKTLVFYKGRAPRGEKTKWVLHEYRLEGDLSCRHACKVSAIASQVHVNCVRFIWLMVTTLRHPSF
ncbi:hypothetical protein Taro_018487, partial [Colocasia esculenta]|nr:hypothetical protein [Colocasia esculenta]